MPIKLTPQSLTSQNRLWTAEVTPPEGGGRPWRSTGPMTVGDLMAALRAAGCTQTDIDKALQGALAQYTQQFLDAEAEESIGPTLRSALAGEYEVPPQRPLSEALIAYSMFLGDPLQSLAQVSDTADFIDRGPPTVDEIAWAFLRLMKRGWLLAQGKLYGLTAEGRRTIADIVGTEGQVFDRIKRLEAWTSTHPP